MMVNNQFGLKVSFTYYNISAVASENHLVGLN